MTKKKYLRSLRKALKGIPEREKEKLIEYYDELIDESFERGKTSKEVFRDLGTPQQVASDYFNANEGPVGGIYDDFDAPRRAPRRDPYYDEPPRRAPRRDDYYDYNDEQRRRVSERYSRPAEPKKSGAAGSILKLLLLPFRIVLAAVLIVLGIAALIVGAALVLAVVAVVVGLSVAGLYCIVMSFGLFGASWEIATAQLGAGVLLLGVSVAASLLIAPTARGFGNFAGRLFRRFKGKEKEQVVRSHGKTVASLAVALCLIIVGGGAGAFGFGKLDWNWRNLALVGEEVEHSETLTLETVASLTVNADNLSLIVLPTDGEAKLVYSDTEQLPKTYSFENGTITLTCGDWGSDAGAYFKEVWSRGILFPLLAGLDREATLYLPASWQGTLGVKINNGALNVENAALSGASFETDNGALQFKNSTFGALSVKTDNGAVTVESVTAQSLHAETSNGAVTIRRSHAGEVYAKTDNGAVTFERIAGDALTFQVGNGAVSGSILGTKDDYKITASTGLGSCNLSDTFTGEKTLNARTGCGAIKIDFVSE